jgi:hypothetical protein
MVLPPAVVLVLVISAGFNLSGATGAWATIGWSVAAAVSLQIGYFVGLACAHLLPSRRANKLSAYNHSTSTQNSAR